VKASKLFARGVAVFAALAAPAPCIDIVGVGVGAVRHREVRACRLVGLARDSRRRKNYRLPKADPASLGSSSSHLAAKRCSVSGLAGSGSAAVPNTTGPVGWARLTGLSRLMAQAAIAARRSFAASAVCARIATSASASAFALTASPMATPSARTKRTSVTPRKPSTVLR
jgi:hypothetical protein